MYHLHRELVRNQIDEPTHISASLCKQCHTAIVKNNIPKLSIAAGVDFGSAARIRLPSLTLVEEYLIAQGRMLISIVKLIGSQTATCQSARRGHVITFPHSGPTALVERERALATGDEGVYPRLDGISDVIFVSFVGSRNQWETHLLGGLPGGRELQVRTDVIYLWLHALIFLNPRYVHINIDDSAGSPVILNFFQCFYNIYISSPSLDLNLRITYIIEMNRFETNHVYKFLV